MVNEDGVKCCTKCGSTTNGFHRGNGIDQGASQCKVCIAAIHHERNQRPEVKANRVARAHKKWIACSNDGCPNRMDPESSECDECYRRPPDVKVCSQCGSTTNGFYPNTTTGRLRQPCKVCHGKATDKYRREHPEVQKKAQLKYMYGIGLVERDWLIEMQGGVDPISLVRFDEAGKPNTDHYNDPDGNPVVRGILTNQTNQALGLLKHDPLRCIRAYLYLTVDDPSEPFRNALVEYAQWGATLANRDGENSDR